MNKKQAYKLGIKAAKNGPNMENCNFSIFETPETRDAWQQGFNDQTIRNKKSSYRYKDPKETRLDLLNLKDPYKEIIERLIRVEELLQKITKEK